nr:MAG TPA: hypothetical protein [Caudoviricetes sp.]
MSRKAQVLLHHWSDGCRCCGGVRAHVTGKSCFGSPSLSAARTGSVEVRHPASCRGTRPVESAARNSRSTFASILRTIPSGSFRTPNFDSI